MFPTSGQSKSPLIDDMKTPYLISVAALALLAASGCDKQPSAIDKKIAELEQKNQESAERQRELEQQLEDQKLAAERDAIERERARIDEDRAELERQQGQAAAEQDEALRLREEAIAKREGKLEQVRETLEQKENQLSERNAELSDRDRELAGREALDFDSTPQSAPVGDYGTFYDSLSSYGSWFETSDYGYVWQPAVVREVDWRPYSRGRWACSDRGWTWISDEPFGWATYHYGRWARIGGRGWVWVPGSEWAPCWVSWRESNSHIGWAPLPPETMAYYDQGCDSTVDVRFSIGAICFNFVEIRHFGSPLSRYCLPVAQNGVWFGQCNNITYIHIKNRQVICGGPVYHKINSRIGGRLPFYRLEVDHHPRLDRNQLALRPHVKDGRLRVVAPNMDAEWNAGLKPKQIRGRIESVKVERDGVINSEVSDRFRQSREEQRERAEKSIAGLGGRERFEEQRGEKLRENRVEVEGKTPKKETRVVSNESKSNNEKVYNRDNLRVGQPAGRNPLPPGLTRPSDPKPNRPEEQREAPGTDVKERREVAQKPDGPHILPPPPVNRQERPDTRRENGNADRDESNRKQQELARNEETRRDHEEQVRRNQQQEKQREAEQARQQQAKEEARREQQQQQQREMQRQQEQARERQQEQARQRQQEQAREQEQSRQREQEQSRQREQEQSRQREQEQSRQREEQSRQQKQKDDDDERNRRNR